MSSLTSWLSVMFMGAFWIFRVVVAVSGQFGGDFAGFIVFNTPMEIALLFASLICMVLIVKRQIVGGAVYFGMYTFYLGGYLLSTFFPALFSGGEVSFGILQNGIICIFGILVGLIILIDLIFEQLKKKHFSDKKTDWYFDNDKYDREMDERADKNQYRTL